MNSQQFKAWNKCVFI